VLLPTTTSKSETNPSSISNTKQNSATTSSKMVSVNTGTDANICTKVSNHKEMVKRPEVTANNPTVQETLLNRKKNLKIQIDTISDIAPDTKSSRRKISAFLRCNS
jgi:hypothetical protein